VFQITCCVADALEAARKADTRGGLAVLCIDGWSYAPYSPPCRVWATARRAYAPRGCNASKAQPLAGSPWSGRSPVRGSHRAPGRGSLSPAAESRGTLAHVFIAYGKALKAVSGVLSQVSVTQPDGTVAVPVPPPSPASIAQELAHQRHARRLVRHQHVRILYHQGWPGRAIAQQLGIGKYTVFRYLRSETLPERKRRAVCEGAARPL
jgi:hypothetical protein